MRSQVVFSKLTLKNSSNYQNSNRNIRRDRNSSNNTNIVMIALVLWFGHVAA